MTGQPFNRYTQSTIERVHETTSIEGPYRRMRSCLVHFSTFLCFALIIPSGAFNPIQLQNPSTPLTQGYRRLQGAGHSHNEQRYSTILHSSPGTSVVSHTTQKSIKPLIKKIAAVPLVKPASTFLLRQAKRGLSIFLADWGTFVLIPVIAAFVGWFTNYLAVQMIFYPIEWRGIPIKRVEGQPMGLFGWQGIVPAKTEKMSLAMVNTTINELLSIEEVIQRLDPEEVATILLPKFPQLAQPFLDQLVPVGNVFRSTVDNEIENNALGLRDKIGREFLVNLTLGVQEEILLLLNVRKCVVNQMMADRSLLGSLFQKTGGKELQFLTESGLWFGFLLGLLQMIVALYWDNPWTLSIGGFIVGLATNWLALKWIFEPVNPIRIGPFTLQGLFLRRQKEVSKDFSNFFATKILTSRQLFNSILTDPGTSPNFVKLFSNNVVGIFKTASRGMLQLGAGTLDKVNIASKEATAMLPQYLTGLHDYVDKTLGIEAKLYSRMRAMSCERFERVLHPIFEEDELTLILSGGFLGFLAGLVQQGLASGGARKIFAFFV